MATPEHVEVVRKGPGALSKLRHRTGERLDLTGADLARATRQQFRRIEGNR